MGAEKAAKGVTTTVVSIWWSQSDLLDVLVAATAGSRVCGERDSLGGVLLVCISPRACVSATAYGECWDYPVWILELDVVSIICHICVCCCCSNTNNDWQGTHQKQVCVCDCCIATLCVCV